MLSALFNVEMCYSICIVVYNKTAIVQSLKHGHIQASKTTAYEGL